jgi:hypothetical protein
VGIIDVLNLVLLPSDVSFFIIDPILATDIPFQEISQQPNPYVIISTQEGSSHRWFDLLISQLLEAGVSHDHIIIRSACLWDPDSPVKHIHTIVDECSDFVTILENNPPTILTPTHHFVCLNRLHRWQRYQLVTQILDRKLDGFGKISYIEILLEDDPRIMALSKPDVDWHEQRKLDDPDLAGALFNVISETAYEPEPGATKIQDHYLPGMTEKSYKCFALHQIPIWLAPYRAVECYRKLGFDVFDDVVDHGYDLEPDPEKRIQLVADQIEKICQLPLSDLQDLKQQHQARFAKNVKTLESYAHNFNSELPQWELLF